ncbi:MAG: phage tail assembly chaperone [Alphaproteobacteria bacterium]|nr:phage tail assembly chaperone [Alphaproteobacteria bacterium]
MRITPEVFWAMSLGEWRAAVNGFARRSHRAAPLSRADLEHLMQLYPDEVPPWRAQP